MSTTLMLSTASRWLCVGCGSDVRLEAYATDDSLGKRGARSAISTNNDNRLRA